eukprot:2772818-Rhodomonas_salina.1
MKKDGVDQRSVTEPAMGELEPLSVRCVDEVPERSTRGQRCNAHTTWLTQSFGSESSLETGIVEQHSTRWAVLLFPAPVSRYAHGARTTRHHSTHTELVAHGRVLCTAHARATEAAGEGLDRSVLAAAPQMSAPDNQRIELENGACSAVSNTHLGQIGLQLLAFGFGRYRVALTHVGEACRARDEASVTCQGEDAGAVCVVRLAARWQWSCALCAMHTLLPRDAHSVQCTPERGESEHAHTRTATADE